VAVWQTHNRVSPIGSDVRFLAISLIIACRTEGYFRRAPKHNYIQIRDRARGYGDTLATTSILNIHNRRGWFETCYSEGCACGRLCTLFYRRYYFQVGVRSMRRICNSDHRCTGWIVLFLWKKLRYRYNVFIKSVVNKNIISNNYRVILREEILIALKQR
jgi:hypothetical protein